MLYPYRVDESMGSDNIIRQFPVPPMNTLNINITSLLVVSFENKDTVAVAKTSDS